MQIHCLKPTGWSKLTESPQSYQNFFAFARKKGEIIEQLHPWVKCRDYLLDGLVWTKDKDVYKGPVYGFPFVEGINTNEVELLFSCMNGKILDQLGILHNMEKELGISPTEVTRIEGTTFYIKADPWWNKSTIHLSMFSIILRTLSWVECKECNELEKKFQYTELWNGASKKLLLAL